jgi:D-alanyl-D-alanine carboxypeptidase
MRLGHLGSVTGMMMLATVASAHGDNATLSGQLQTVVDTYLADRQQAEHISGVALHVDPGHGRPVDVFAGTDGHGSPIDDRTLFQIGSITKSFTATLILKLEAEGKLSIDQTVGDWLPQYPDWANITIRSLLSMTSPIPNYTETVDIAQAMAADLHHQFSYQDLIAAVYGKDLPIPSGWFYSNTNNILAGLIIEAASGLSYRATLRDMLRPLRLHNTFYADGPYPPRVLDRLPVGIYANPACTIYQPTPCTVSAWAPLVGQDVSDENLSWAGPAGAAISNIDDIAAWVRALFGLRVIPHRQLQEMTSLVSQNTGQPIPDTTPDNPRGFGLDLGRQYQANLGGSLWFYQGMSWGFRVIFAYWPQYDLVITTATNSQPPEDEDKLGSQVVSGAFQALQNEGLLQPNKD